MCILHKLFGANTYASFISLPDTGMKKGPIYRFVQEDPSNYYHAIGFAYGPDGALGGQPELEPTIKGLAEDGSDSTSTCDQTGSCPAPMYRQNGVYLGNYSNIPAILPETSDEGAEDFGLDAYEPQFFYPILDWLGSEWDVFLRYPADNDFVGDFFYFCHIHNFMSGRIKFVDAAGNPITPDDSPEIPYDYQVPSAYDQSCGTFGLEEFQLPNHNCPTTFTCDKPGGAVGEFASCVDSMNCAMMAGMTSNVATSAIDGQPNAIGLFNHQMIPHHQNAVNMCKALLISGECDCDDLTVEADPKCVTAVICQEIINVQNAQIQIMRGVLNALEIDKTDDCVVSIKDSNAVGECEDDADFLYKGKEGKGCDFIAGLVDKKKNNLCGKKSQGKPVKDSCPLACGICVADEGPDEGAGLKGSDDLTGGDGPSADDPLPTDDDGEEPPPAPAPTNDNDSD